MASEDEGVQTGFCDKHAHSLNGRVMGGLLHLERRLLHNRQDTRHEYLKICQQVDCTLPRQEGGVAALCEFNHRSRVTSLPRARNELPGIVRPTAVRANQLNIAHISCLHRILSCQQESGGAPSQHTTLHILQAKPPTLAPSQQTKPSLRSTVFL